MFAIKLFPAQSRMLIVARGFWDMPDAERFYDSVRGAFCAWAGRGDLRLLSDLSDLDPLSTAVSEVNVRVVELIEAAPIDRYALVAPRALVRMQARRLLQGVEHRIFTDRNEAAVWLGWPSAALDGAFADLGLHERYVASA